MSVRAIDKNNDWLLNGKQAYNNDDLEVLQNVKTRLQQWKYNCYFALEEGVDYNNYLSDKSLLNDLKNNIIYVLINTFGVSKINDLTFNLINRKLQVNININTIYSNNQQIEYTI